MIFRLSNNDIYFPQTELAEPDGLLAIGGDLSEGRLLLAYANGIFPWYSEGEPILWYAPHERCVIYPDKIKVSKSMQQTLKQNKFKITVNQCFGRVIMECAAINRKNQDGTWINNDMIAAYVLLHKNGWAHSIEVWLNDVLAGGLYGVGLGNVFCGESMFSIQSNTSKIALIHLCRQFSFTIIDCQVPNNHLMSMGAEMIPMSLYQKYLQP